MRGAIRPDGLDAALPVSPAAYVPVPGLRRPDHFRWLPHDMPALRRWHGRRDHRGDAVSTASFDDWAATFLTWCDACDSDERDVGEMRECPGCSDSLCRNCSREHIPYCSGIEAVGDETPR
jgi:hypothetical protein